MGDGGILLRKLRRNFDEGTLICDKWILTRNQEIMVICRILRRLLVPTRSGRLGPSLRSTHFRCQVLALSLRDQTHNLLISLDFSTVVFEQENVKSFNIEDMATFDTVSKMKSEMGNLRADLANQEKLTGEDKVFLTCKTIASSRLPANRLDF